MSTVRLDAESIEAVALRVVELLDDRDGIQGDRLLSVAEFAKLIGRSTDYVRAHAVDLGGVRQPTSGRRALWRFPASAAANGKHPASVPEPPARQPPRRRTRAIRRADLLPIRGERE